MEYISESTQRGLGEKATHMQKENHKSKHKASQGTKGKHSSALVQCSRCKFRGKAATKDQTGVAHVKSKSPNSQRSTKKKQS